MTQLVRDLEQSDMERVNIICSTTWGGNDYIPEVLPDWIDNPDYIVRGLFDDKELLSICALQLVPSTGVGYISGLRTKEDRRREGHGMTLAKALIEIARERGVNHLLYLTINFNKASVGLAKRLGFSLGEQYGHFHLYTPFPPHPTPSPALIPLKVNPERVEEVIRTSPNLIPHNYIPFDYQFYQKSLENLRHISERTTFQLIVDNDGQAGGFYYGSPIREDRGEQRTSYIVYATNRAIFVDMMARIVDEIDSRGATRVTFHMGPNGTEWVTSLGYTDSELGAWPGEYSERRLLLYEKQI